MELFLPIKGVPEYFASANGVIRTFDRCSLGNRHKLPGRVLKQRQNASGHCIVNPSTLDKLGLVHRMVMAAFTGNHVDYPADVHHQDENKLNNTFGNLVYQKRGEHSRHHARIQMSEAESRTGFKGVIEHKQRDGSYSGRYHGQFNYMGALHWTPTFGTPEEAYAAVCKLYQEVTNEYF
jgi:hypothetical protein